MQGLNNIVFSLIVLFGAFLIMMMALPVRLHICYRGKGKEHSIILKLRFFNDLLGFGKDITMGRQVMSGDSHDGAIKRTGWMSIFTPKKIRYHRRGLGYLDEVLYYYLTIKRLINCLRDLTENSLCRRFVWSTTVGFDDYAATGLAAGLLWGLKGYLVGRISRRLRFLPPGPLFRVIPKFGKRGFEVSLDCILEMRLGHIIIQLIVFLLWRFLTLCKRRTRRWKKWATIRSRPS